MNRVVPSMSSSIRSAVTAALVMGLLATTALAGPVMAQDLPPCEGDQRGDCRLPDWSDAAMADVVSPFGNVDGLVWITDERADTPPAGIDILAVGLGRVDIADPAGIRASDDLLKLGGRKKAVSSGPHTLVRIVVDRPLGEIADGYSGVHVVTDVDGSRSNNAPTGVGAANSPFAASQDIYSLTYAATTGKSKLLASDLAKGWYKTKTPFAAMWAAPDVLDVVLAPQDFGGDFRVVSYASGPDGGYDIADIGGSPIPADGRMPYVANCIEASVSTQPFTVRRLVENGQTLRDVEAPASWRGGGAFPLQPAERDALRSLIDAAVGSADQLSLPSTVSLFEDGVIIRQRPDILMRLDGDDAVLSLELGLTRRGYDVIRDIELQSTGDALVDAWLGRATDALTEALPPFRVGKAAGLIAGEALGGCVAALTPLSEPAAEDAEGA